MPFIAVPKSGLGHRTVAMMRFAIFATRFIAQFGGYNAAICDTPRFAGRFIARFGGYNESDVPNNKSMGRALCSMKFLFYEINKLQFLRIFKQSIAQ